MRLLNKVAIATVICSTLGATMARSQSAQQTQKKLTDAAKQGFPLNTDLTVKGNVTAQAVLLPPRIASRIFGGEIGKYYAVIELTVANKSPDAALIIQGAYIDYTNWALSGSVSPDETCTEELNVDTKSPFQSCTRPDQVASEEYRIARGQLLNMQPWTYRNATVRLLTLLGSIASGYSFSIKEMGYIKGISAFNGTVVPGVSTFWPDQTIDQMNRISDFGYQTNKVIPKQGSDIIVCFFPIDRFLTQSFRKLFAKNPAIFFSPFEMLVDKKVEADFAKRLPSNLKNDLRNNEDELQKALPCYVMLRGSESPLTTGLTNSPARQLDDEIAANCLAKLQAEPQIVLALDSIRQMSLNTVRVVIDGVMSVETGNLPAKIESVEFDGERTDSKLWTDTTVEKKGTITGAYLTGGVPKILEADKLGITSVAAITQGSSDQNLHFSLKLSKPVSDQTQLTFVIEKTVKDSSGAENTADSAPFTYKVEYVSAASSPPPQPTGAEPSASSRPAPSPQKTLTSSEVASSWSRRSRRWHKTSHGCASAKT